jgi:hypothetical protein
MSLDDVEVFNPKKPKKTKKAIASQAVPPSEEDLAISQDYITDPLKVKTTGVTLQAGASATPWQRGPVALCHFTVAQRPVIKTCWGFFRAYLVCRWGFVLALEDQDIAQQILNKVLDTMTDPPTPEFNQDATTLARKCVSTDISD